MSVIAPGNDCGQRGVNEAACKGAGAYSEVPGILVEKDRKDAVAEDRAAEIIGVCGPDTLKVAGSPVPISGVRIRELAKASAYDKRICDVEGVDRRVAREAPLLAGGERDGLTANHSLEL